MTRPTGFYWIRFAYPDESRASNPNLPVWEPAGWDAECEGWMFMGDENVHVGDCEHVLEVGPRIEDPVARGNMRMN